MNRQQMDAGLVTLIHIPTWSQGVRRLPLDTVCVPQLIILTQHN